ncbi:MAG TPA: 4Fe-4S binding protein [Spirochaetota bacterium]|nr:4Fe-4S binding protein [Spirochaetota bacterium]
MAVTINNDLCTGCGRCERACLAGAIMIDETIDKAVVNPALCSECGVCVNECKRGALSFEYAVPSPRAAAVEDNPDGFIRRALSLGSKIVNMGGSSGSGAGIRDGSGCGMGRGSGRGMGGGSGRGMGSGRGPGSGKG